MKIIFIGQQAIPVLGSSSPQSKRVEALATKLAGEHHDVFVISARSADFSTRNFRGVKLLETASFDPQKPGGWLHLLLAIRRAVRIQPDVIHIHGWKAAFLLWLMAILVPETTFIWTIDRLPKRLGWIARGILHQAQYFADEIVVPGRRLQYEMLMRYGVRTTYIPDGYEIPKIKDIPLKTWGLRKGQYVATTSPILAIKELKMKKKIVSVADMTPRQQVSILKGAALVIVEGETPTDVLLSAMDSGKAVIATSEGQHEEILGTTGWIVPVNKKAKLAEALRGLLANRKEQAKLGTLARKRAQAHFTWERILPEYEALYHRPLTQLVPLDSAQPIRLRQLPA